ncbi:hypothetical protein Q3G72_015918 [Acer saccharum]|nr:hypothetical protein Q3G72_015918 [Acer saccharum]
MAIPEEVEQSNGGAREQEEVDRRRRMRVGERTPSRFIEKNDEIKNRRGGRRKGEGGDNSDGGEEGNSGSSTVAGS